MAQKVLVGMSGGVDSAVCAYLLKKQGFKVSGATMSLFTDNKQDICDAKACCDVLKIEHTVLEFSDIFKSKVMDYFANSYKKGETPNPCIMCNKYLKFGAMLCYALDNGFDFIATGHYCKVVYNDKINRWLLYKSKSKKDQSYMLYSLTQEILSHTLMPLSDYSKEEIRNIAKEISLPIFDKPDSQDICFIKNNDYKTFLTKNYDIKLKSGDFIDINGDIIGKHSGIINYTVGQRKGLGVSFGKPMFVKKINARNNTVTLCENEGLFSNTLVARDVSFIPFEALEKEIKAEVKVRYSANPEKAKIAPLENNRVLIEFNAPQRAITCGQAVVFYDGNLLLGGGIIDKVDAEI